MSRADLYERLEQLGEGGQGRTFKARDTRNDDIVVVKEMHLTEAQGWDAVKRFDRECEILGKLKHPGIPRYLDHYIDEDTGRYGLVMELAPGRPLSEHDAAMSEADLNHLAFQVLHILEYLHSRRPPVIHRDIKPANIVRADDGEIRLVDFGGVKEATGATQSGSSAFGTYGYMAPEQYRGKASVSSDLYGLGATLLSLSTGKAPEELPDKPVLGGRVPKVAALMPASKLRDTIEALMAPAPEDRPADVRAARSWLAHGKSSTGPFRKKGTLLAVILVMMALLGMGAGAYLAQSRSAPPAPVVAVPARPVSVRPIPRAPAPPIPQVAPADPSRARYRSSSRALAATARRALEIAGAAQLWAGPPVTSRPAIAPPGEAPPRDAARDLATAMNKDAQRHLQLLHLQACEGHVDEACRLLNAQGWRCAVTANAEVDCVRTGGAATP